MQIEGGLESEEISTIQDGADGTEEDDSDMQNESSLELSRACETPSVGPETAATTTPQDSSPSTVPPTTPHDSSTSTEPPPTSRGSGSSAESGPSQPDKGKRPKKALLEESDQKLERSKIRKLLDNKLSKMMQHMEDTDKAFEDNMSRLSGNMDKLTGAITAGFSLLQKMLSEPTQHSAQSVPMPAEFLRSNTMYYPQPAPYQLMSSSMFPTMPSNPLHSADQRVQLICPTRPDTEATEPTTPNAEFEGPEYMF